MKLKCIKSPEGWAASQFNTETEEEELVSLTSEQVVELEALYDEQMAGKNVEILISFDVYRVTGFSPLTYKEGVNICNYRPSPTEQSQHRF